MHEITCAKCQSVYEVITVALMERDKDKVSCEVCGEMLLEWDAAVMYRLSPRRRGQLPEGDGEDRRR